MSDITPDTHFLESVRADRGQWWALLAEGIDNGFDAGATEIAIALQNRFVELHDNGSGITRDRQLAIVRFGEHRPMPTTSLGMFGIGLKYHAVSAGDRLDVESVSADGRLQLHADWSAVIKSGLWQIDNPRWVPSVRTTTTGTRVRITRLRWRPPTEKDIQTARERLAQVFHPALVTHRRILINDHPLTILREPLMTKIVEADVRLPNGKGAHVRGGVVVDQSPTLAMVHVSYKHRVIMPRCSFGCEDFSGLQQMFARVDLTGPWTLARFKNDLADNDAVALEKGVAEILRPVLEACHSANMSAQIMEMTQLLNDLLPLELAPARPRQVEHLDRQGLKRGTKPDRVVGDQVGKGPTRTVQGSKLVISFEDGLVETCGYGQFVPGHGRGIHRVQLSRDNEHVAMLLELRDKEVGARSLLQIALGIYLQARRENGGQRQLDLAGPFGLELWNLVKRQPDARGAFNPGVAS